MKEMVEESQNEASGKEAGKRRGSPFLLKGTIMRSKSILEEALQKAEKTKPGNLPVALPLGHTGSAENFTSILSSGALQLTHKCRVMRKKILYLFYGGLFYRSSTEPTQEESAYPIGFLFHPKVLERTDVYYPFDTGAAANGIYKSAIPIIKNFKGKVCVTGACFSARNDNTKGPRLLVKHLFGSNRKYLAGTPDNRAYNKPEPIPEIVRFFVEKTDKSDHRRTCIETQRASHLLLNEKLLWMGYPDIFEEDVQSFLRRIDPHIPKLSRYPSFSRFRPSDICSRLDGMAQDELNRYIDMK